MLRDGLQSEFGFTASDLAKVEAGEAVARMVPTNKPDDVRMAGVVLIHATPEAYVAALRDIDHMQVSKEVIRTHRFSSPPVIADLNDFPLPEFTKKEVLDCRPGHCAIKLPAEEMEILRNRIDWNSPEAVEQVGVLIKQRIISYLDRYLQTGESALAVYSDAAAPYSVAQGLRELFGSETHIARSMPELIRFALTYPANRPPDTEDFLYWQEAAFGLKHVLRAQQVMIQKLPGDRYAIISKMLFASHYFRAAVEYSFVAPVRTASGETVMYVATSQRSYVDGMTGVRGAIVHKVAESRSPGTLAENLRITKKALESKLR
jgi:hypothetical protein